MWQTSARSTRRVSSAASPTAGPRPTGSTGRIDGRVPRLNPAVTGHPQVAPKPHVEDIVAAEPGLSVAVFTAARTVAGAIGAALDVDGHSLAHASGPLVGTVEHAHVHLLPRRDDDAVSMSLARCDLDDERGAAPAERIREAR